MLEWTPRVIELWSKVLCRFGRWILRTLSLGTFLGLNFKWCLKSSVLARLWHHAGEQAPVETGVLGELCQEMA